ncbi:MAG: exodeoxyribonuclease alpha subunit [Solirubrobacteraceae bacterium]
MSAFVTEADPFDVRLATNAPGLLRDFNDAGVLTAADVHVAVRLLDLVGEEDESVALAAALGVRGPRLGHVYVDLATIRETVTVDADEVIELGTLAWPPVAEWTERLAASGLVALGEEDVGPSRPLRLVGTSLYLDRYWREERQVAAELQTLGGSAPDDVTDDVLAAGLARLYPGAADHRQRLAARSAVLHRFAVVAGGPGTGKTTTVARIVALLAEQAAGARRPVPLVALAAPTGKAAARLEEAVHEEAATLDVSDAVRAQLLAAQASTLHRLLGWRPGSHSRFRHHRGNRLPHDVVIVDETSMVSLSLMARLVEAVRPEARLVLVGDPGQLTSIEAGAVLGDIVGPAADDDLPAGATIGSGIVVLDRVHRFGGAIAAVADAIRRGDADAAIEALTNAPDEVTWLPVDAAGPDVTASLAPVHDAAVAAARGVIDAARAGDARRALEALASFRVLCAHRRGPYSVAMWMDRIERWLAAEVEGFGAEGRWYVGRPLLVTENDYGLRLYNGDTGVVVATEAGRASAAFERSGEIVGFSPSRLSAVDTVYAMTIHKSQGSQFATAAVLLPDPTSRILTRELLYTAVTRARERLILAGTQEAIRAAVSRPVARASGLLWRLWGDEAGR